jgi:hypothetical protein
LLGRVIETGDYGGHSGILGRRSTPLV